MFAVATEKSVNIKQPTHSPPVVYDVSPVCFHTSRVNENQKKVYILLLFPLLSAPDGQCGQ